MLPDIGNTCELSDSRSGVENAEESKVNEQVWNIYLAEEATLVSNPEERFSRQACQVSGDTSLPYTTCGLLLLAPTLNVSVTFSSRALLHLIVIDRSMSWVFGSLNVRDRSME